MIIDILLRLGLGYFARRQKATFHEKPPEAPQVAKRKASGADANICHNPEIRLARWRFDECISNVPNAHGDVEQPVEQRCCPLHLLGAAILNLERRAP